MTEQEQISLLVSVAPSMLLFTIYWIGMRPRTRLYRFRDDMFALRDQVFDAMRSTKSSFEDPGYKEFRRLINGTIQLSASTNPLMIGWLIIRGYNVGERFVPASGKSETDCVRLILQHAEAHYMARIVRFVFFDHATGWIVSQLLLLRSLVKRRILWWRALDDNRAVRTFFDLACLAGSDHRRPKAA